MVGLNFSQYSARDIVLPICNFVYKFLELYTRHAQREKAASRLMRIHISPPAIPERITSQQGIRTAKSYRHGIFANIYIISFFAIISIGKKNFARNFFTGTYNNKKITLPRRTA